MSIEIDKIIQKIKKLLAMAEHANSNPNEAARAASMAVKMMTEYQVSREDVIRTELERGGGLTDTDLIDREYAKWPIWMQGLAISTAKLFECKVDFTRSGKYEKRRIILVGYEADVQMVKWMYEYLHDELERLAKRAMQESTSGVHGSKIKASFLSGAVISIKERFKEIIAERMKDYRSTGKGLVLIKKDAIRAKYGDENYRNGSRKTADIDAYRAGVEAGKNVNINRPLGNGGEKQKALSKV